MIISHPTRLLSKLFLFKSLGFRCHKKKEVEGGVERFWYLAQARQATVPYFVDMEPRVDVTQRKSGEDMIDLDRDSRTHVVLSTSNQLPSKLFDDEQQRRRGSATLRRVGRASRSESSWVDVTTANDANSTP